MSLESYHKALIVAVIQPAVLIKLEQLFEKLYLCVPLIIFSLPGILGIFISMCNTKSVKLLKFKTVCAVHQQQNIIPECLQGFKND